MSRYAIVWSESFQLAVEKHLAPLNTEYIHESRVGIHTGILRVENPRSQTSLELSLTGIPAVLIYVDVTLLHFQLLPQFWRLLIVASSQRAFRFLSVMAGYAVRVIIIPEQCQGVGRDCL